MKKVLSVSCLLLMLATLMFFPTKSVEAGSTYHLGGLDLYRFCRHMYVLPPGNYEWINNQWYCTRMIGTTKQGFVINLDDVCRWQYGNWGNVWASNHTGDRYGWTCYRYVDDGSA